MPISGRSVSKTVLILAALSLAACSQGGDSGAKSSASPPVEVGTITIHSQRVEITTELPGRTSAYLVAEVRPQVTGIIQKRLFKEGSEVKAGDLLYQINPASYQAAYDSAAAAAAKTAAALASAQAKSDRYKSLYSTKVVSQQDFEDIGLALGQARADTDASKAALETAQINLDNTRITAPISGVIGRSAFTEGALVTTNQTSSLATVQELDQVYVDVTESTSDFLRLRMELDHGTLTRLGPDAEVKLILENGALYPQPGSLQFTDATVNENTGAVTLRTLFPNPDRLLLPGMYVRAVIVEGVEAKGILVPQRGVTRDAKGAATALFVTADNKVEQRTIGVRRTIGDSWLVDSGVNDGDRIIIEGLQKVRQGQAVHANEITLSGAAAPDTAAPGTPAPAVAVPKT